MNTELLRYIYIGAGGGIGAVLRYGLGGIVQRLAGNTVLPWGTLMVNVSGCLVIGLLWELFEQRQVSSDIRVFCLIGILGGYTTFSSFAIESRNLLVEGQYLQAAGNVLLSNVAGIVAVFAGIFITRACLALFK
ncbi:MAG: fluoride efflux transporter CrcB [Planctomycetaceae bacterium]|nr:MAG: fluoride efflux transporter CrcB [Planctomycetaceae bacterium]